MSSSSLVGHQTVLERFARLLRSGTLANTYLFSGPAGIGKYETARHIARCLLCEGSDARTLEACGECHACHQVDAATHPDLLEVHRPPGKNVIPLELLIGEKDKRMREGLCHDLAIRPFRGKWKIAIINDADFLNQEGANCLLKTLEEPPEYALLILITSSEYRQLNTIRSRSQIVRFQPLDRGDVETIIRRCFPEIHDGETTSLALASEGSLETVRFLLEEGTAEIRSELFKRLASLDPFQGDFPDRLTKFVDQAGSDATVKRNRLRSLADQCCAFFGEVLVRLHGQQGDVDETLATNASALAERWKTGSHEVTRCLNRCLEFHSAVAANANTALLIESLLSDLGKIMRGEPCS